LHSINNLICKKIFIKTSILQIPWEHYMALTEKVGEEKRFKKRKTQYT